MKVEQISIFLENKPGGLEEVTRILKDAGINIRTLSLADTSDFGILRLIVNDVGDGQARSSRRTASGQPDHRRGRRGARTGRAASTASSRCCPKNGINVEYLYAFVERSGENAVIIFRFDAPDRAIEILTKSGFTVLPGDKVYSL